MNSNADFDPRSPRVAIRALVIEDARPIRLHLRAILEKLGVAVVGEAADGEQGVKSFKSLRPDVTLLDINMPVMGGLEALKVIKTHDPGAQVVMLTSQDETQVVQESIECGATDYLLKNLSRSELLRELQRIFAGIVPRDQAPP